QYMGASEGFIKEAERTRALREKYRVGYGYGTERLGGPAPGAALRAPRPLGSPACGIGRRLARTPGNRLLDIA
ncbi:hypothetical protein ABTX86_23845, partial [Streptomyces anulatus]